MSSSPPQVSVIVPLLPEHRFFAPSIASVAGQEFDSFEIILVDGGASPDLVSSLVAQFYEMSIPVKWFRDYPGEIAVLRNRGIRESSTPFVAFHNYEDIMVPGRLKQGFSMFVDNPDLVLASSLSESANEAVHCGSGGNRIEKKSFIWSRSEELLDELLHHSRSERAINDRYHIPEATTMMVRRKAALAAGLYDRRFTMSPWATLEFSLRLYEQGEFGLIKTPLVQKFFKSTPITSSAWTRSMEQMDLFYALLSWRYGFPQDRKRGCILNKIRGAWLRYWSGWFFRYRDGRRQGIKLSLRALESSVLDLENWKWIVKTLLPQSQYPRLFWFDLFIEKPIPSSCTESDADRILSDEWSHPCF